VRIGSALVLGSAPSQINNVLRFMCRPSWSQSAGLGQVEVAWVTVSAMRTTFNRCVMRNLLAAALLSVAGVALGASGGRAVLGSFGPVPEDVRLTPLECQLLELRMERLRRLEREFKQAKTPEQKREANRRAWEDYWSACEAACDRYGVKPPPWAARQPEVLPVRPE
jgi:hypothetical protein